MKSSSKGFTSKQMGDACEMLVAAELTLAGVPSMKVPDYWPGYDVIAHPAERPPQGVSVKSRHFKRGGDDFFIYLATDSFDWLALVILPADTETRRRVFIVPRALADNTASKNKPGTKTENERYFRIDAVSTKFGAFENNFTLSNVGIVNQVKLYYRRKTKAFNVSKQSKSLAQGV